ncbi:hypothetical protein Pelo_4461 [Pelomyxa schiedti]|nr:hypothetical protein Pelo_4461 [Pelomyxa schiedti]
MATVEREGYLNKQGKRVKSWKRRWFTLTLLPPRKGGTGTASPSSSPSTNAPDPVGTIAYAKLQEGKPINTINLVSGCKAYIVATNAKASCMFNLEVTNRTFIIEASSPEEAKTWVEAINSVIKGISPKSPVTPHMSTPPLATPPISISSSTSSSSLMYPGSPVASHAKQQSDSNLSSSLPNQQQFKRGVPPLSSQRVKSTLNLAEGTPSNSATATTSSGDPASNSTPATGSTSSSGSTSANSATTSASTTPATATATPASTSPPKSPGRDSTPPETPSTPTTSRATQPSPLKITPSTNAPPALNQIWNFALTDAADLMNRQHLMTTFSSFSSKHELLMQELGKMGDLHMVNVLPNSRQQQIVSELCMLHLEWGVALGDYAAKLSEANRSEPESQPSPAFSANNFLLTHLAFHESLVKLMSAQHHMHVAGVEKIPEAVVHAQRFLDLWKCLLDRTEETNRNKSEEDIEAQGIPPILHLHRLGIEKSLIYAWVPQLFSKKLVLFGFLHIDNPSTEDNFARSIGREPPSVGDSSPGTIGTGQMPIGRAWATLSPTALSLYTFDPAQYSAGDCVPPDNPAIHVPLNWIRKLDMSTQPHTYMKFTYFVSEPSLQTPLLTVILKGDSAQETTTWLLEITQSFQAFQIKRKQHAAASHQHKASTLTS